MVAPSIILSHPGTGVTLPVASPIPIPSSRSLTIYFLDSKVDINQRTTENMLQQCSLDSQKRASIENTTLSLFENQTEITDRIERMDKEIQGLGEKVLEIIPSLWIEKIDKNIKTDEENETNGLNFYNESVKMETDGDKDKVDDDEYVHNTI